jgi:hypothetical protein
LVLLLLVVLLLLLLLLPGSQLVCLLHEAQVHPAALLTVNDVTQQLCIFHKLGGAHAVHRHLLLLMLWQLLQCSKPCCDQGVERGPALVYGEDVT